MPGWPAHVEHQVMKQEAAASAADRALSLLARYPNVSGAEASEILSYLRRMRYVEMERLASDQTVRRQLDVFLRAHKEEFRYAFIEIVTFVALIVAFLAICWVLWHPVGGG
jgi:hypothetical protein